MLQMRYFPSPVFFLNDNLKDDQYELDLILVLLNFLQSLRMI
jgi:hypothetical protein